MYIYTVSLLSDSIYNIIGCDNLIVTLNLKLAIKMMLANSWIVAVQLVANFALNGENTSINNSYTLIIVKLI